MDARETVEAYYTALRAGDPLGEFFADPRPGDDAPVKVGISERLVGADAIRAGLRQQTTTTRNWTVGSRELRVCDRDDIAWFTDAVDLSWTDDERDERLTFDTRWSGVLEQRDRWQFVGMHVSAPREL